MHPTWLKQYVGIPFNEKGYSQTGSNCWGILYMVYKDRYNILLPNYSHDYTDTRDGSNIKQLIAQEINSSWIQVKTPQFADAISLSIQGQPWHCALYIGENKMLHCERGLNSCIERLTSPIWKAKSSPIRQIGNRAWN